jgi:NAD(P)-dependent dehydrogenase (short-subunit alcohol dehydrogenase family)
MQEAAKWMADNGRIINMETSLVGATTPYYSAYAGSKAPLEDFTRALAKEIGNRDITVNNIAPGRSILHSSIQQKHQNQLNFLRTRASRGD